MEKSGLLGGPTGLLLDDITFHCGNEFVKTDAAVAVLVALGDDVAHGGAHVAAAFLHCESGSEQISKTF